jgi:hypothetical protein
MISPFNCGTCGPEFDEDMLAWAVDATVESDVKKIRARGASGAAQSPGAMMVFGYSPRVPRVEDIRPSGNPCDGSQDRFRKSAKSTDIRGAPGLVADNLPGFSLRDPIPGEGVHTVTLSEINFVAEAMQQQSVNAQ